MFGSDIVCLKIGFNCLILAVLSVVRQHTTVGTLDRCMLVSISIDG